MDIVKNYFFANIIIVDNIDNAINISEFIENKYKIITLDGQIINPGGIMTGGHIIQAKDNIPQLKNELQKLTVELDQNTQKIEQLGYKNDDPEINRINEEINNFNVMKTKYTSDIQYTRSNIERLRHEFEEFSGKEFSNELLDSLSTNIIDQVNEIKINIEKNSLSHKNSLQSQKSLLSTTSTLTSELLELNDRFSKKHTQNEELKTSIGNQDVKLENYISRLSADHHMTEEHALNNFLTELDDIEQTGIKVDELRSELDKIGSVNLDAIDEYKIEKEKYDNYNSSINEFNESQSRILESIDEMDKVVIDKFSDIIEKINEELSSSFSRLFGGGSAKLIYTDPDNILETGIEVKVHPPGKKVSNLNLLSGGEKSLVALSVLFAILKVKPIPLSILDEAESQLDIGNVVRFIEYVKSFEKQQFIVITHRPGTMEKCDVLYGVTMQQKGVTSLVKVTINEAEKYIDKNEISEEELN